MTCEILVMNGNSVSIGVDSAITVGGKKTADGFRKLFKLDDELPMGLMIYGSANFEKISMENLIADFCKDTDFSKVNTVMDVKDTFIDFLANNTPHHDFKRDIEILFPKFKEEVIRYFARLSREEINLEIEKYSKLEVPEFLLQLAEYDQLFKDLCVEIGFNGWKALKNYFFYQLYPSTGIVIVGFSDGENYPSYVNIEIILNNGGNIEIQSEKSELNSSENMVVPFAQTGVIWGFLDGIHPEFFDLINQYISLFFSGFLNDFMSFIDLKSNIADVQVNNVSKRVKEFKLFIDDKNQEYMDFLNDYRKYHLNYKLEALGLLSKKELAEMVEILIKVTSLRYRASMDLNIVGGEVNVAVISKFDGFVWVKKEEYYSRDLNYGKL